MRKLLFILMGIIATNCFAATATSFANDMYSFANIIWRGGNCYKQLSTQLPNLADDLDYQVNQPQDFMSAYKQITNPVDQQVAYMSNLLSFQIINDYLGDSASQFNNKYCSDNNSRKVYANDLLTEALTFDNK